MTVVDHVWSDEVPLRKSISFDVRSQVIEVAVSKRPGLVSRDVVADGARVVFSVEGKVGGKE